MSVRTTDGGRARADVEQEPAHAGDSRVATLDTLRGVAVAVMVAWHASDAWLSVAHRGGAAWSVARVVGGLAAPLFLLASGAAVAIGAARGRSPARAIDRGLSLMGIGLLLNVERWAVDRGAMLHAAAWPAIAFGAAAGLGVLLATARARPRVVTGTPARRVAIVLAPLAAHVACVWALDPRALAITLRFDVLHCIGACSILAALLVRPLASRAHHDGAARRSAGGVIAAALLAPLAARSSPRSRAGGASSAALLACLALAIVLSTPHVAGAFASADALAWIAGSARLAQVAPFPVVPWCAYAIAGCAIARAAALAATPDARDATRRSMLCAIAVLALLLAIAAFEGGLPWTRRALHQWPSVRPAARLVFHTSAAALIACVCALSADAHPTRLLRAMGRASLAIYVLHVPVTYGVPSAPIARALSPLECASAVFVLLLACAAGASIAARVRCARSRMRGGDDAHMFARHVGSTANLHA